MAKRRTSVNTDNSYIVVDSDKEEIIVITDNDVIIRVYIFADRIIINSNRKASIHTDHEKNTDNVAFIN